MHFRSASLHFSPHKKGRLLQSFRLALPTINTNSSLSLSPLPCTKEGLIPDPNSSPQLTLQLPPPPIHLSTPPSDKHKKNLLPPRSDPSLGTPFRPIPFIPLLLGSLFLPSRFSFPLHASHLHFAPNISRPFSNSITCSTCHHQAPSRKLRDPPLGHQPWQGRPAQRNTRALNGDIFHIRPSQNSNSLFFASVCT